MLLVNARAGVSAIHGIGLIAREFIPRGTRVWEFRPGFDLVLSESQVRELSAAAREQVFWYAYYDTARRVYVLSADDDRFTNHADDPNTANDGNATHATRDIRPGEELTWDYRPWGGLSADDKAAFVREPITASTAGVAPDTELDARTQRP